MNSEFDARHRQNIDGLQLRETFSPGYRFFRTGLTLATLAKVGIKPLSKTVAKGKVRGIVDHTYTCSIQLIHK